MHYATSPIVQGIAINVFAGGALDGPTFLDLQCTAENWTHKWDQIFVAKCALTGVLAHIPHSECLEQDKIFLDWLLATVMALGTAARHRQDAQTWNTKKRTAA